MAISLDSSEIVLIVNTKISGVSIPIPFPLRGTLAEFQNNNEYVMESVSGYVDMPFSKFTEKDSGILGSVVNLRKTEYVKEPASSSLVVRIMFKKESTLQKLLDGYFKLSANNPDSITYDYISPSALGLNMFLTNYEVDEYIANNIPVTLTFESPNGNESQTDSIVDGVVDGIVDF